MNPTVVSMPSLRSARVNALTSELRDRLDGLDGHGDKMLVLKVKLRNGVPHKAIWSEEEEETLD